MCKTAQSLSTSNACTQPIDPYTNIEHAQAVETAMEKLSATATPQMALIRVPLHFDSPAPTQTLSPTSRQAHIQQSLRYYGEHLRHLVRKDDQVFLCGQTLYFLLAKATLQGAHLVHERLWEALLWRIHNASEAGILQPTLISIGYCAYPQPAAEIHACMRTAHETRQRFELQPERSSNQLAHSDIDPYQLARKLGIPYLSLLPRKLPATVLEIIRPELAHELHCYPVGRERNILTVAMSDPRDNQVLTRLQEETGLRIFPVLASPHELQTALAEFV